MWTISDVITQAREILQDVIPVGASNEPRHSDEKLIGYLNNALADARRLRPDLFLPDLSLPTPFFTTAELGDPFPIQDIYFTAVVEYIAGFTGMGDDEFAQDGRAATLLNRFTQKLTMKGA